jgi:microcompartment protein CcmL/EutN
VATARDPKSELAREIGTQEVPALAFLELSSISRGLYLTDVVLKKAPVRMVASQPVSSGKHVLLYAGDVASVEESHRAALEASDGTVLKQVLIPGVHADLAPFLDSLWAGDGATAPAKESLGIIESTTLAGALLAADRALKAAAVSLCRMRLGQGIGGKAYFVITGRQEEVEAGVEAAESCLRGLESLCRVDLIARPDGEALAHF